MRRRLPVLVMIFGANAGYRLMTFSIAKFLSHSGARTFFSRQGVLFVVAVALFAVLWGTNVRGPGTGFVPVLLYTLVIGNLTTPIMNLLPHCVRASAFPLTESRT